MLPFLPVPAPSAVYVEIPAVPVEVLMFSVLFRENGCNAGGNNVPADTDLRIIPHDAAFSCRIVKIGTFVRKYCCITQYIESVCESFRNVKLVLLFTVENYSEIPTERL